MRTVKTLGLLGTGVIGSGWAARALHCGLDVVACDRDPAMEAWIRESVAAARPAQQQLTEGLPLPPSGKFSFTVDLSEMVSSADFVQESVPEVTETKKRALHEVAKAAPGDVIIASSTSGFLPSELQEGLQEPERFVVGHPFNPVYLCPLVEIVGGKFTSPETKIAAGQFYRSLGMHVLNIRREVPGHISDRLQEAMWREILHLLNDDIASTGELDESIVYGPGLRWSAMGMNQLYMMAGGQGGAGHFLRQFGPTLKLPWCHMKAPELTETLIDRFVEGTAAQADSLSIRELESIRDECLVAIQKVLARHDVGSGRALNAFRDLLVQKAAE